jgi:hypothetical protein
MESEINKEFSQYVTKDMLAQEMTNPKPEPYVNIPSKDPAQSMWELDAQDLINELIHIVKGHIKDYKTGEWIEREGFEIMNDNGINDLVVIPLHSIANKNTYLSNLDEERVYYLIRTNRIKIVKLIGFHYNEYGISKNRRDFVVDIITTVMATAIFRCKDGGERRGRFSTEIRKYVYGSTRDDSEPSRKEKKGLLGLGAFGL